MKDGPNDESDFVTHHSMKPEANAAAWNGFWGDANCFSFKLSFTQTKVPLFRLFDNIKKVKPLSFTFA